MVIRQALTIPVRFLRSIVVLPLISPDLIFVLKLIGTWLGYASRANLGTFNLLGFYYPAAEAQGDNRLAQRYTYQAWIFSIFCVLIAAIVGAFFYLEIKHIPILIVWGMATMLMKYMANYYQARGNFNKIAIIDITNLVVGFFIALGGLLLFGFDGLEKIAFFQKKLNCLFKTILSPPYPESINAKSPNNFLPMKQQTNTKLYTDLQCLIWCCFLLRLRLFYWADNCCLTSFPPTKK